MVLSRNGGINTLVFYPAKPGTGGFGRGAGPLCGCGWGFLECGYVVLGVCLGLRWGGDLAFLCRGRYQDSDLDLVFANPETFLLCSVHAKIVFIPQS